jgi:hypothetical protein
MASPRNSKKEKQNSSAEAKWSERARADPVTVQYLVQTLQELQSEHEALKQELLKSRRIPSGKIGVALLITGSLVLAESVFASSPTLAFIGLGLTFWGALFLFARPIKFVRSSLLDSTAVALYTTIDRMVQDLGYKAKSIYVPPYPKEAYLPEYLKGLKEMVVFIPAEDSATMPTLEEMAKQQFLLKNPKGICITPPGFGLSSVIENELRAGFPHIARALNIENLYDSLPKVVTGSLGLAKTFEIKPENELIHVRITGSVHSSLYSREQNLKSIHFLGCPLTSAVACALAKATGKLVTIAKDNVSYDLQTIDVWYQTLEA